MLNEQYEITVQAGNSTDPAVQNVYLTIPVNPAHDVKVHRRPWCLGWTDDQGNRFHIWISAKSLIYKEGEAIYKNPPADVPRHLTGASGRMSWDDNPEWFETRQLRSDTKASQARLKLAFDTLFEAEAVRKALEERDRIMAERNEALRKANHEREIARRIEANKDRMVELLRSACTLLQALEEEEIIGQLSTTEEIRFLLQSLDAPTGFEPAVKFVSPEVDNSLPF